MTPAALHVETSRHSERRARERLEGQWMAESVVSGRRLPFETWLVDRVRTAIGRGRVLPGNEGDGDWCVFDCGMVFVVAERARGVKLITVYRAPRSLEAYAIARNVRWDTRDAGAKAASRAAVASVNGEGGRA